MLSPERPAWLPLQLRGVDGLGAHRGRGDRERGTGAHGRGAAVLVPLDGAELRNLLGRELSPGPVDVGCQSGASVIVLEDRAVVGSDGHRDGVCSIGARIALVAFSSDLSADRIGSRGAAVRVGGYGLRPKVLRRRRGQRGIRPRARRNIGPAGRELVGGRGRLHAISGTAGVALGACRSMGRHGVCGRRRVVGIGRHGTRPQKLPRSARRHDVTRPRSGRCRCARCADLICGRGRLHALAGSARITLDTSCTSECEAAAEALGNGHIGSIYRDGDEDVARLRHGAGRCDGDGLAVSSHTRRDARRARDAADAEADLVSTLHTHDLRGAAAGLGRRGRAEEGVRLAREDDAIRICNVND